MTSAQTGSRNMAVTQASDSSSNTSWSIPVLYAGLSATRSTLENYFRFRANRK